MSTFKMVVMWFAAVCVTLWMVRRFRSNPESGPKLVGRFSPRFVRMVAVIAVALGLKATACAPTTLARAPVTTPKTTRATKQVGKLPAALKRGTAALSAIIEHRYVAKGNVRLLASRAKNSQQLNRELAQLANAPRGRTAAGTVTKPARLLALVDALEADPQFGGGIPALLFRGSAMAAASPTLEPATARMLAALYERLSVHARVDDAFIRAERVAGRPTFMPWMRKSGPPPNYKRFRVPPNFGKALEQAWPKANAGTWASEGTLPLTVSKGAVRVLRAGTDVVHRVGARLALQRLDVIMSEGGEAVLTTAIGPVTIGADNALTA